MDSTFSNNYFPNYGGSNELDGPIPSFGFPSVAMDEDDGAADMFEPIPLIASAHNTSHYNQTSATSATQPLALAENTTTTKHKMTSTSITRAPSKPRREIPETKTYIEESVPKDSDVVSGRGGKANHHPGNKACWLVMINRRKTYKACETDEEKNKVAQGVIDFVAQQGGRYVQLDEDTKRWFILPNKVALEKAKQGLRDKHVPKWVTGEVSSTKKKKNKKKKKKAPAKAKKSAPKKKQNENKKKVLAKPVLTPTKAVLPQGKKKLTATNSSSEIVSESSSVKQQLQEQMNEDWFLTALGALNSNGPREVNHLELSSSGVGPSLGDMSLLSLASLSGSAATSKDLLLPNSIGRFSVSIDLSVGSVGTRNIGGWNDMLESAIGTDDLSLCLHSGVKSASFLPRSGKDESISMDWINGLEAQTSERDWDDMFSRAMSTAAAV